MMEPHEMIDAWLGGELNSEELAHFESLRRADKRLDQEARLAQRLGTSLQRSFGLGSAQPRGVSEVLESLGRIGQEPQPAPNAGMVGTCLAAAAGLLLLFAQFDRRPAPAPLKPLMASASSRMNLASLPPFHGAERSEAGRLVPNLEGILCTATHFAEQQALQQCVDKDLEQERIGMGDAVGLSNAALGLLQGPISASEWPGSMVFASPSSDGLSLLIAGSDDLNTCCLDVQVPDDSDLRVFTWRVGNTLWYEFSPFDEPRLLSLVDD